jgi:diadenylate cyclase
LVAEQLPRLPDRDSGGHFSIGNSPRTHRRRCTIAIRSAHQSGRAIDGRVSPELLETIFMRGSPLHDGAVIIKGDQILAAACLLPLSSNPAVSQALGTRHRAAIGLTEDNDAVVIVVSEEDGTISIARHGELMRGIDTARLLEALQDLPS